MKTITVNLLNQNLNKCIEDVIRKNDTLLVNCEKGNAVIVSETNYLSMLGTIYHDSQTKSIKDGEKEDISSMSTYNPDEEW